MRAIAWTVLIYGALLFFDMMYVGPYIAGQAGGPTNMFAQLARASDAISPSRAIPCRADPGLSGTAVSMTKCNT
tara:strand:- start:896 stop:1117 length:222 start_codon:yes stop_codon:yes gene_type:complete